MVIRAAGAADLADVERIAAEAFAPYVERIGKNPAPMDADYPDLIARGWTWVALSDTSVALSDTSAAISDGRVALSDARVAGFCVVIPEESYWLLDVVAVAASCRGQGLGRRLITFAEDLAWTAGQPEMRLYTHEKMVENQELYPHLGYREIRRSSDNGFRRVHFAKSLAPPSE